MKHEDMKHEEELGSCEVQVRTAPAERGAMADARFTVFFDIYSDSLSLTELRSRLGVPGSNDGYTKGDVSPLGKARGQTLWRFEASTRREDSLSNQIQALRRQLPLDLERLREMLPGDACCYLNIGAFYKTAYCSIDLQPENVREFVNAGVIVGISAYPVDENPA